MLKIFGVRLIRIPPPIVNAPWINDQMFNGLARLKQLEIPITTIVDIGAAAGSWTLLATRLWPECSYMLFEPLEERADELKTLAASNPNIFIVPYAAGKTISETRFHVTDDLDGSGIAPKTGGTSESVRVVKQTSVDIEIKKNQLTGPYLVKLDTHGYEIPIIEGCEEILDQVSAFIIECYGFQVAENSLLFWEMCRYMDNLGFRLFDIVDIMNRPKDGAFWQCDAFFIRKENALFNNNSYN